VGPLNRSIEPLHNASYGLSLGFRAAPNCYGNLLFCVYNQPPKGKKKKTKAELEAERLLKEEEDRKAAAGGLVTRPGRIASYLQ
jgi:hypothetical protein